MNKKIKKKEGKRLMEFTREHNTIKLDLPEHTTLIEPEELTEPQASLIVDYFEQNLNGVVLRLTKKTLKQILLIKDKLIPKPKIYLGSRSL